MIADRPDVTENRAATIDDEAQIRSMVNRLEQRERLARRNALLYTLLPVLAAIGLLVLTGWQVQKASQDVAVSQAALSGTQKTLSVAEANLSAANQQIEVVQKKLIENSRLLTDTLIRSTQAIGDLNKATLQLAEQQKALDAKQAQLDNLQKQTDQFKLQIGDLSRQLSLASQIKNDIYQGHPEMLLKHIMNMGDQNQIRIGVADLLQLIVRNLDVPWKIDGISFKEGVNSPTYAALILSMEKLLSAPDNLPIDQATLMKLVPTGSKRLQMGDLVYYGEGYALFYFEDEQGQKVVIGMTPLGVVALNYDFAQPTGFASPFH